MLWEPPGPLFIYYNWWLQSSGTPSDFTVRVFKRKPTFQRYAENIGPQIVLNHLKGYLDIKDMTFEAPDIENDNDHGFGHCSEDTDT